MNNISKLLKKNNTPSKNKAYSKQQKALTQANMEDFGFISNSKASSLNLVGTKKTAADVLGTYAENKSLYSNEDYLITSKLIEKEILTADREYHKQKKILNARHRSNNIIDDEADPEYYYRLYEQLLFSHKFRLRAYSEKRLPRQIPADEIQFVYEDALAYVKSKQMSANNFLHIEAEEENSENKSDFEENKSLSARSEHSLFGTPKSKSFSNSFMNENSSVTSSEMSSILVADGVKVTQSRKLASEELQKLKRATKIINDELSEEANSLLIEQQHVIPANALKVEAKVENFKHKVSKMRRIKGIVKRAKKQLAKDDPIVDSVVVRLLQNANEHLQVRHPAAYLSTFNLDSDEVILNYYVNDLFSLENYLRKRKRRQNQHGN